jgi:hypothetical protein
MDCRYDTGTETLKSDVALISDFSCMLVGWIGLGEDRDSMAAFLFTWPDGDTSQRPLKLPKVGGAAQAVLDRSESGPIFGPDGLKIPLIAPEPKRVWPAFCRRTLLGNSRVPPFLNSFPMHTLQIDFKSLQMTKLIKLNELYPHDREAGEAEKSWDACCSWRGDACRCTLNWGATTQSLKVEQGTSLLLERRSSGARAPLWSGFVCTWLQVDQRCLSWMESYGRPRKIRRHEVQAVITSATEAEA